MKRGIVVLLAIFLVLLAGVTAIADQSATKTSSSAIVASGAGWFLGIIVVTDGTNAVTLDVYDNGSAASGTKLIPQTVVTTSSTNRVFAIGFDADDKSGDVYFYNGLYVNVTCAGTVSYMVYYRLER